MKVQNRSKSTTRSGTPKRILCQKPPFPKLIQKKPKPQPSFLEQNKENLPLTMILPEDSLLIKPNELLNSLYTQSPIGDLHICLPYELGQNAKNVKNQPILKKTSLTVPKSHSFYGKICENAKRTNEIPLFLNEIPVFSNEIPVDSEENTKQIGKGISEISIKVTDVSENSPIKKEVQYSKLPPRMIDRFNRTKGTPKVTRIEISVANSYDTPVNCSQGSMHSASAARNNRVKLLSKNFEVTRNTLTKYSRVSSLNSTPEPTEY